MFKWVKKLIGRDKPEETPVAPVLPEDPVAATPPIIEDVVEEVVDEKVAPIVEVPALPPVPVPPEESAEVIEAEDTLEEIVVAPVEEIILRPAPHVPEPELIVEAPAEIITEEIEEEIQTPAPEVEPEPEPEIGKEAELTGHPALYAQDPEKELEPANKSQGDEEIIMQSSPEPVLQKKTWFKRLKDGLAKSSSKLTEDIKAVLTKRKLDQSVLDEIEEILIMADVGVATASKYVAKLKTERFDKEVSDVEVREFLAAEMAATLQPYAQPLMLTDASPHVVLMVGVNGTGKTTTIGKLAQKLRTEGHSVMMAAGDTFRAAAIEQLKVWADRTGAIFMGQAQGGDAAALAFDALQRAKKEGVEVLLIDTAGRLHNKKELMEELSKIVRVLQKQDAAVPHDTVLVLDATTGQNAYAQVKTFQEMTKVSGLIVTKLDGTAKGGVVVGLADQFKLPIHAVGVGETVDDLHDFDATDFAKDLMGLN